MRINVIHLVAALAAAAATGGIVGAPTAAAGPLPKRCILAGADSSCLPSRGIPSTVALPAITPYPFGDVPQRQVGR